MYCYIVREYVALQKFKDRLGFRETHHSIIVHVFFINWVYQQSIDSVASPLHVVGLDSQQTRSFSSSCTLDL